MTQATLENAGGTLLCDILALSESQDCNVAIRGIPTRTLGPLVDTGTFTLKFRRLKITIRFSDVEKTTLQAIFDQNLKVIITIVDNIDVLTTWQYMGWFVKKPITYAYSKDENDNVKEWVAKLEFDIDEFLFVEGEARIEEAGLDWAYFKNEGEIWLEEESGGYIDGYPIYFPEPLSIQGGGYLSTPVACSVQRGQNAIPNPSFESDFAGWMRSHAGDFTIDTVIFYDGAKSCRYEGTDLSGAGPYIKNFPDIAVSVNGCLEATSTFNLYLKAEYSGSSVNAIRIVYSDLSRTTIHYTAPDTNWHEVDILSYAEAGKTISAIELSFLGDGKKWWIDLIQLIP